MGNTNSNLEPFTYDDVNERRTVEEAARQDGPAPQHLNYAQKVLHEIRDRRDFHGESRENEAYIHGLKRALELYLGSAEARQYLTDNGESSN